MSTTDDVAIQVPVTAEEPRPLPAEPPIGLPSHPFVYRVKNKILGRPLHSEQLHHERLGKPTALAVFASDNLSSCAYATEEILHVLVPAVGVAAFSLVVPLTGAMVIVLSFLILSYRETIKAYPKGASAYLVTKDNLGQGPALVAGSCLLLDYVLTVAVSVSAGSAALASAFHVIQPWRLPVAIGFVGLVAYMNLRGIRESGRIFAVPTYFFIVTMGVLIAIGVARALGLGEALPVESLEREGLIHAGSAGEGLFYGAALFTVLKGFASGGAAVTGVEAISDGVPAFKTPEWKNARTTLTVMGGILAVMFMGLSYLASKMHVAPFEEGTPTVISEVGRLVFGESATGHVMFYALQAATMLILVLAANTGFADFPRLASFQAADNFLPRQLTKRGHRLVFSNGILALSVAAIALVIVTDARVEHLIPLYAIGVFTSFTLSQLSMSVRAWRRRDPKWQRAFAINAFGGFVSCIVALSFAVTKFKGGAWVIIAAVPIMVMGLRRLAHQYTIEAEELKHDVPRAATARILDRHVVLVLIDSLDLAAARAIQYARTLTPDELRAVHFILDPQRAEELAEAWRTLGLTRVPLELRECSDRLLDRAAIEAVAEALADGKTEVSVLVPDRQYKGWLNRVLHDRTSNSIVEQVSRMPHANVTRVPYHLGTPASWDDLTEREAVRTGSRVAQSFGEGPRPGPTSWAEIHSAAPVVSGATPISNVRYRKRVKIAGTVRSLRVQPSGGVPSLECVVADATGSMSIVFLGRREIAGLEVGRRVVAAGMVGEHAGRLAMLNPVYELLAE